MSHIITLYNNQPTVSHRVIAERTENQEKAIRNTITKNVLDFEEFGAVHFKNAGVINNGKGDQPKTYFLNEQQATLLLTYLRNSSAVRAFKVALVKELYKLREEVYQKKVKESEIVIVNTTEKEQLGTLGTQNYMLKNEVRELRRVLHRMTYNDEHVDPATGSVPKSVTKCIHVNGVLIDESTIEFGDEHLTEGQLKIRRLIEKGMKYDALFQEKTNIENHFMSMANNGAVHHFESLLKMIEPYRPKEERLLLTK